MEEYQQNIIIENLPELLHKTYCNTDVLQKLYHKRVISVFEKQQLGAISTDYGKNSKLYEILQTRSNSFDIFIEVLMESNQSGVENLLKTALCKYTNENQENALHTSPSYTQVPPRVVGNDHISEIEKQEDVSSLSASNSESPKALNQVLERISASFTAENGEPGPVPNEAIEMLTVSHSAETGEQDNVLLTAKSNPDTASENLENEKAPFFPKQPSASVPCDEKRKWIFSRTLVVCLTSLICTLIIVACVMYPKTPVQTFERYQNPLLQNSHADSEDEHCSQTYDPVKYNAFVNAIHRRKPNGTLEKLLDDGTDVQMRNKNCRSFLHVAAHFGNVNAIRFLLGKDIPVNIVDNIKDTPLHNAFGNTDAISTLVQAGANILAKNRDGNTFLHLVALFSNKQHFQNVMGLVKSHPDFNALIAMKNYSGKKATELVTS